MNRVVEGYPWPGGWYNRTIRSPPESWSTGSGCTIQQGTGGQPVKFWPDRCAPSHPELLDWLATEFVQRGWSMKAMHRLIMTSAAYRQSSRFDPAVHQADPDNVLLSRMPLRRMDAETLYDSV